MGRLTLILRLAVQDLRHRRAESVPLLLALAGLTVIPAQAGARRMPAEILQAENS